jgi:hypothetical protein
LKTDVIDGLSTTVSSTSSEASTPNLVTSTVISRVSESVVKVTTDIPKISIPTVDPKSHKWIANGTNSSIIVQMAVELIVVYQNSTSKQV